MTLKHSLWCCKIILELLIRPQTQGSPKQVQSPFNVWLVCFKMESIPSIACMISNWFGAENRLFWALCPNGTLNWNSAPNKFCPWTGHVSVPTFVTTGQKLREAIQITQKSNANVDANDKAARWKHKLHSPNGAV